jgi:uncharacterized protein (TIGR03067 family)
MHRISFALIVAVTTTAFAQDDKKDDLAKIQGKWEAKVGPNKDIPLTIEFKDKSAKIFLSFNGEDREMKGEFKLDETKSPKEWTWTKFENPQGNAVEDNLAIYKLDGDKLTICSGGPGNERPKEFKAGDDGAPNLVELTRVKDEKKAEEQKDR